MHHICCTGMEGVCLDLCPFCVNRAPASSTFLVAWGILPGLGQRHLGCQRLPGKESGWLSMQRGALLCLCQERQGGCGTDGPPSAGGEQPEGI